jgi:hypothetical protein
VIRQTRTGIPKLVVVSMTRNSIVRTGICMAGTIPVFVRYKLAQIWDGCSVKPIGGLGWAAKHWKWRSASRIRSADMRRSAT